MRNIVYLLIIFLHGCATIGNSPLAIYTLNKVTAEYTIVLEANRALMVHTLSLFGNYYHTELHIKTKKITGVIDASGIELIQHESFSSYKNLDLIEHVEGTITFLDDSLIVDLKVPYADTDRMIASDFNGKYELKIESL